MKIKFLLKIFIRLILTSIIFVFIFLFLDQIMPQLYAMILIGASGVAAHFIALEPFHDFLRIKTDTLKNHHDFTGFVSTMFATLYGVFLAFIVISTEDKFADIKIKINQEVQMISTLSRTANQLPKAFSQKVDSAIAAYLTSVIQDEWPLMHLKKESPKTLEKVDAIWLIYKEFHPKNEAESTWYTHSLNLLDRFNETRIARIYGRWEQFGYMSWTMLLIGAVYVSTFLFFFGTNHNWIRVMVHSMVISFITMAIYLIYTNETPFRHHIQIKPEPYQVILKRPKLEM